MMSRACKLLITEPRVFLQTINVGRHSTSRGLSGGVNEERLRLVSLRFNQV
jgi:hypothetical protein